MKSVRVIKTKSRMQLEVENTYFGIKSIKNQIRIHRDSTIWEISEEKAIKRFSSFIEDWNEFNKNISDEMRNVPIIMIEIDSIESLIKLILEDKHLR